MLLSTFFHEEPDFLAQLTHTAEWRSGLRQFLRISRHNTLRYRALGFNTKGCR
jgi:hypothetical protein